MTTPNLPETGDFEERDPGTNALRMQVRFENGRAVGTWKHFRRDGTPTWEEHRVDGVQEGAARAFHPDGSVSRNAKLSAGRWHGPTQWFGREGSVEVEGAYKEGVRDGVWRWLDADGRPRTIIRFVPFKRPGNDHPHERIEYLRSHPNGNKKTERIDRDGGGWTTRTYYEDGTLESETPYETLPSGGGYLGYGDGTFMYTGVRHGVAREFHPDGSSAKEETWERGERVGELVTWSEDGKKNVVAYESGAPLLADAKLKKLAAKMAKKRDAHGMRDVLERAKLEWGEHSGAVWQMFRRGLLTAGDGEIWEMMDAAGATPEEGIRLVSQLPDSRKFFAEAWSDELDTLVLELAQRDPEVFETALPELSRRAQRGVKLVLARLGRKVDRNDDRYFLGQFASRDVENRLGSFPMVVDGMVNRYANLRGRDQRPTPLFFALIETFTTPAKWAAAVRKARPKAEYPAGARVDHFEGIEAREELMDWLGWLDPSHKGTDATAVLESREDDLEDLLWIAEHSQDPIVVAAASVVAVTRGATTWPEVDPKALAALPIEPIVAALMRTPNDELATGLVATGTPTAIAAVCSLPGRRKLWRAALEHVVTRPEPDAALAESAARVGAEGLDLLAEAVDAHPGSITLRLAALQALASTAEAGKTWAPERDALLVGVSVEDEAIRTTADAALRTATKGLPRDRQIAVAERAVGDARETWYDSLAVLGPYPSGTVLSKLFARLVHASVDEPTKAAVSAALGAMDERRYAYVRWALRNDPSESFVALLRDAYGTSEELAQDFEALAPVAPAKDIPTEPEPEPEPDTIDQLLARLESDDSSERTPIYAPRWTTERPSAGEPGFFNQVGGVPPGFSAESWPTLQDDDPEPMDFLFMVDLAAIPELAAAYPGKRAMAMFIGSAGHNEAYEPDNGECELVWLEESELQGAPLEQCPGIPMEERHYELVRLDVPLSAFGGSGPLESLVRQLPTRFLGEPTWIQDEEHWGELLLQFDDSFVPMNLGDCGIMYVFDDAQFWQCG